MYNTCRKDCISSQVKRHAFELRKYLTFLKCTGNFNISTAPALANLVSIPYYMKGWEWKTRKIILNESEVSELKLKLLSISSVLEVMMKIIPKNVCIPHPSSGLIIIVKINNKNSSFIDCYFIPYNYLLNLVVLVFSPRI